MKRYINGPGAFVVHVGGRNSPRLVAFVHQTVYVLMVGKGSYVGGGGRVVVFVS